MMTKVQLLKDAILEVLQRNVDKLELPEDDEEAIDLLEDAFLLCVDDAGDVVR